MNFKVLILGIGFVCITVNGVTFDEFQNQLNKAADDVSKINRASGDRLKESVGIAQDPPTLPPVTTAPPKKCGWFGNCVEETTTTTTPPPTPAPKCGGWFQSACPSTTTTTTTTPPPTTAKPCGGWFQSGCETSKPKGLSSSETTTTTTKAPTTPVACGGWFQSACDTSAPKSLPLEQTTTTTEAPAPPKACGGWFQPACETSKLKGLSSGDSKVTTSATTTITTTTTTTPKPTTTAPCGGWFRSACTTLATTTPAPEPCGGWFQSACPTTTTTPLPKRVWGLFGNYAVVPTTTEPPQTGWLSGILTGFTSTVGKGVNTALDVTSMIATSAMNGGVDFFLNEVKIVVKALGMDVVPLPDVDIDLYPGAHFKANGGYFKSVLSLSRGGDITISRSGMAFILDFPIVLRDMEIGFKNYSIAVLAGIGPKGNIKVGVKENKINIRIRLAVSTSCAINLEKVDFAVLDGLDINMSYGCSMCGFITDKATSYLTNFFRNTIRLQIQGIIDGILKTTLSENALICSKFMGA